MAIDKVMQAARIEMEKEFAGSASKAVNRRIRMAATYPQTLGIHASETGWDNTVPVSTLSRLFKCRSILLASFFVNLHTLQIKETASVKKREKE